MFDSFPYESWLGPDGKSLNEDITRFWTWAGTGGGASDGTITLTVLGMILMVVAIIAWFWLESRKLNAQAAALRAAGGLPVPGGAMPGAGPSQPPLAGPTTDPGA
jgi:hypothetical protein